MSFGGQNSVFSLNLKKPYVRSATMSGTFLEIEKRPKENKFNLFATLYNKMKISSCIMKTQSEE